MSNQQSVSTVVRCRGASLAVLAGAVLGIVLGSPALADTAQNPGSPAVAAAYPPPTCFAQVSSTTVVAGGQLTVSGNCFRPGSGVAVKLDTRRLAIVSADAGGVATATVTIPADTGAGSHIISLSGVRCTGVPLVESVRIQVVARMSAAPRHTGDNHTATPLEVGGTAATAAVAGGAVLLRRRRRGGHRDGARG